MPLLTEVGEIRFRVAVPADGLCIAVLATQVFLDTYATQGIRPSIAAEVLEQLSTSAIAAEMSLPASSFLLAELAGHLIGFAQWSHGSTHELVQSDTCVELNRLYVQERFCGKGIGKALLLQAQDMAAARGASALWLTAWVGNQRALAFYAACGYQDLGATLYVFQHEQHENRVFAKALPVRRSDSVAQV